MFKPFSSDFKAIVEGSLLLGLRCSVFVLYPPIRKGKGDREHMRSKSQAPDSSYLPCSQVATYKHLYLQWIVQVQGLQ